MTTLLLVIIYIAFISLGLPDALLGAAWPVIQPEMQVPYGSAGIVQMIISGGTILSSLFSSRLIRGVGTGRITAVSVVMTAVALLGFSFAPSFWWLLVAAVPLGLGAGSVDSALNSYIAIHYESRHMSWLHSFWGIGALTGPLVLSVLLAHGFSWRRGYLSLGIFQALLVTVLVAALPLWDGVSVRLKSRPDGEEGKDQSSPLNVKAVILAVLIFIFYCGLEGTVGLWGGSFLFKERGLSAASAARWVSLYYASITLGRFLTGFFTYRVSNPALIRTGGLIVLVGVVMLLSPLPIAFSLVGFILIGLGCSPVYPCMLHETPANFGKEHAQTVMGFQMASSYVGSTFLPPLFGFVAAPASMTLFPLFLTVYILILLAGTEGLRKSVRRVSWDSAAG